MRKNTKKSIVRKYLSIVGIVVGVFVVIVVGGVAAYFKFVPTDTIDRPKGAVWGDTGGEEQKKGLVESMFSVPLRTNVLVMGINENDSLADSIFVVCFNAETKKIDMLSIPRDTYIVMSPEKIRELKDDGRAVPSSGVMKMNAAHSYPGKEKGTRFLQDEVESLLDIKIDYYVELDTAAFREIVNAIGGVEFDVPAGGLYYEDPIQNLVIAVPGGRQKLNGKLAEGLVRYRSGYARADLHRIEVQHEFMKALLTQVLNRDNITDINKATDIITTLLTYVKTDFGVSDLPKYLKYLPDIKADNMSMRTLPGEAQTIYHGDVKASYFIKDDEEAQKVIDEIFFDAGESVEEEDESSRLSTEEVKALNIQVLNGSEVAGLAARSAETLKAAGYNVVNTGNYTGTRKKETRVMTSVNISSDEFEGYFKNVVTERDAGLPKGYDIIIIVGTDES